jgi:hypothetical protein
MAYVNQSMSVRAANAYEHGERPISRWSKRAILDAALNEGFDADEVKRLAADARKAKAEHDEARPVKALIEYGEWEGSRNHPRLVTSTSRAVIVGGWAVLADGRRKRLTGRHIRVLARYDRAPRGTAAEYRLIMGHVR